MVVVHLELVGEHSSHPSLETDGGRDQEQDALP